MNSELIYDALNEISDEHIVEAATFEPKAKILPWKKIVAVAACFGVVAVSAFAAVNMGGSLQPTTSDYDSTYPATYAPTTVGAIVQPTTEISQEPTGTTVAYAPPMVSNTVAGTSTATTQAGVCTTSLKWDQRSYAQCYPDLQFNNLSYVTRQGILTGEEKLSSLIGTAILTGKDDDGKEHTVNADVYEIKGVAIKCAVALYFKDGAQKQLSAQGYYVYAGKDYIPETLGAAAEELNFKDHLVFEGYRYHIYYDTYDAENYGGLIDNKTYYMNEKISEAFFALLENSKDANAELRDYDSMVSSENIAVFGRYLGGSLRFGINSDGYLFIGVENDTVGYNIGKDAFNSFKNTLETEGETMNNTVGLVTTTATTTTQRIAY